MSCGPARRRRRRRAGAYPQDFLADGIALLERFDKIQDPSLPQFGRFFRFARGWIAPCPLAKPAAAGKAAAIALDNGPVHAGEATRAALARAHWLTPELNSIKRDWKILKTHHLAHETFHDRDALNAEIEAGVQDINSKRKTQALVKSGICA